MDWRQVVDSPSKSFFVISLGFLLGIFVGGLFDQVLVIWPMVAGMLISLLVALFSNEFLLHRKVPSEIVRSIRLCSFFFFFFLFGLWRFSQVFFPSDAFLVSDILNREVRVEGVVTDEVVEKSQSQQVVIDQVQLADRQALGKVMVWFPKYPTVKFGDEVAFRCQLEAPEPFEGFAYDRYLRTRWVLAVCWWPESVDIRGDNLTGVISGLRSKLLHIKKSIYDKTEQIFSEPHSTFLSGLLFGGKGSISTDLRQDFINTGTSHILAASGYNVGIFSRFFFLALVGLFFKRKTALILVAGAIGLYIMLAGFDPAVVRAGIMGLIIVFGRSIGRARNDSALRNILVLTASVMLLINPRLLFDDVGFQLSFLATVGLVMIVPRIEHRFKFIPTTGGFREAIVSTLAATIMTLPIVILQFGQLSIVAPLVNLLVLPLVPYAMGFGLLAILIGYISVKFAALISVAAWTCLSTILYLVRWFGALSLASVSVPWPEIVSIIVALILVAWLFWLYKKTKIKHQQFSGSRHWGLASVVFVILFMTCFSFQIFDSLGSNLSRRSSVERVWFFDVGQGDAMFIQTSDNKQILIDGGPGESVLPKLGAVMPFWDRSIDMIISTHPHSDHISGLIEVLDRYQVDQVVMTGVNYRSSYLDAFEERVGQVTIVDEPMDLDYELRAVFPDQSFRSKNIDEVNETSIVIELVHGETSVLFTGDMYLEQEAEVLRNTSGQIDVLKVPHHGSVSSSSTKFLESLGIEATVITVGEDNSYGHPHPVILQRLQDQNIQIYRTDLDGDVLLISDGLDHQIISRPLIF